MKLAISNIAWTAEYDTQMYGKLKELGYEGLEIAPTRIFTEEPYDRLEEASAWAETLKREFGLQVASMQSIWFGRTEKMFESDEEREALLDYTKKAIDFAEVVGCKNLVFGSPKNRNIAETVDRMQAEEMAAAFFKELGEYAAAHHTVLAMEANPPMYGTNFINTTGEALELIKKVDSKGFLLNLDMGTIIVNGEVIAALRENVKYINHVHISEPGLAKIEERNSHRELLGILQQENYQGFLSIEMGKREKISEVEDVLEYVKKLAMQMEA